MRLADFIEINALSIVDGAEAFAATQAPLGIHLDTAALRDHIPEILQAVVLDLRTFQGAEAQQVKSEGRAVRLAGPPSAARSHGRLRAKGGFNVDQMVAEYRALRAAVLRLWFADHPLTHDAVEDIVRFNEAIDQAVAESVADFSTEAESWRQVFLGLLGHDLRGPLSVIVTTSELMSRMTQDVPFTEHTNRIIRSGKRMSKLLDDLLDYSRTALGQGIRINRTEADLQEALGEEIDLLRAMYPTVKIHFDATGNVRGSFDASRIREALSNLVTNAAKYGDQQSDIVVALSGDDEEVMLVVRNSGAVLPPESLGALFEPLQRGPIAANSGDEASLGLGLFIVREIARAHGGEVTVSSLAGTTSFTMRLPRGLG
ncbi:MAG TPA: sensor histidine kinase [Lysobacter sp.]